MVFHHPSLLTTNMDNNTNTMENRNNISENNNTNNIPMSTVDPDSNSGSPRHSTESASAFYRMAAQNLREFYGVKSMAASSLKKTIILLHLTPRRLVVLELAPRRLLKETLISPQHAPEYRSDDDEGALLSDGTVVSHEDTSLNNTEEEMDKEEKTSDDNTNTAAVENKTQEKKEMEPRHLIHAALVAGGVQMRPREAKALLRALNVSPHRFVRLGLVDRKAIRPMHEGKVCHGFSRQRGLGSPYRRAPSMGKSRRGPPHDPPRGTHFRRGHMYYGSWFDGGIGHSSPLPLSRGYPGNHKHFLICTVRGCTGLPTPDLAVPCTAALDAMVHLTGGGIPEEGGTRFLRRTPVRPPQPPTPSYSRESR